MVEHVEKPFSTILALSIMALVRERDQRLLDLRDRFRRNGLSETDLATKLAESEAILSDAVLDTCQKTMATLESTVDSVLQIQEQLRMIRSAP